MEQVTGFSRRLVGINYELRGALLKLAQEKEARGEPVEKLHIGNPAPFGFEPPAGVLDAISQNLHHALGYSDSRGLPELRSEIAESFRNRGARDVSDERIFVGNGVSELIATVLQALLNPDDEVLVPAPDYPLWTAAIKLAGARAVPYVCDEASGWLPDMDDIRAKTGLNTRAVVLINPNNPTGALYPRPLLEDMLTHAEEHGLAVLSDEIYSDITFDNLGFHPMSAVRHEMNSDATVLSFNGISKNFLAAGLRCGWVALQGRDSAISRLMDNMDILAALRLCANVPAMYGAIASLRIGSKASYISEAKERLEAQRAVAIDILSQSRSLSFSRPAGAFYVFPELDVETLGMGDDAFCHRLLEEKNVLVMPGKAFNALDSRHFRMTFLPDAEAMRRVCTAIVDLTS